MISWKDAHVHEEIRKDRIAKAEQARIIKAIQAEDEGATKKEPNLLLLSAATQLVKLADALRARGTDLSLANES
jgi:hypothetical protein